MSRVFPPRSRTYFLIGMTGVLIFSAMVVAGVTYYATPKYSRVGYAPVQPIKFSHKIHVGQLGLDCTYCHNHVDESSHANVPSLHTCWNCHGSDRGNIKSASPSLAPLRESWETGKPLEWIRIHQVPDYAYFNHAVHVARGVSCVSCHGQINEMEVVSHVESLSMGWCLECHRNWEPNMRPAEQVTNLEWPESDPLYEEGKQDALIAHLRDTVGINPPEDCSACHR